MGEALSESEHVESQESHIEDEDLWSRLRESIERLATVGLRKADPAAVAEKLAARAKQLRGRMTTEKAIDEPIVFLAFYKGTQRYGIPINEVIEVQALEHFSPVPGTPSFISGVIHWRGDVLALLDLGRLFEIPEPGLVDVHVCVIVERAGRRLAVVAREIEEIFVVAKNEVKPTPELPGNVPPEWVMGVHDDNRLILRMDQILQDARLVDWRQ